MRRTVLFVGFVLVLIMGALSSLAVTTVRSAYPQTSGELRIAGLSGSVQVLRNEQGVADIYADNPTDLFTAQGFVHAQDRFWQMDFRRHITAGRLSELFGPSQVETDTLIRTMGWRRVAEQELPLLSAESRRLLNAYSDGVNAYLRSRSTTELSLEYSVLGLTGLNYSPQSWSAVDSLAWLKAMAWDLSGNAADEIERALLTPQFGPEQVDKLFPTYDLDRFAPIVEQGAVRGGRFRPTEQPQSGRAPLRDSEQALFRTAKSLDSLPSMLGEEGAGVGSNSWAIAGSRTSTGQAMLGNDPHLATAVPSLFQQVGLHCTTVGPACPYDVSGFSFAGMPGVVIGHNQQISWGLTTPYVDVQDLYLEEIRDDQARVGDDWQPLEVRTEQIRVKGEAEPRTVTVRASRHGPLMSDASDQYRESGRTSDGDYAVALSWTALTPRNSMDAIFALNRAQDFESFRSAAAMLAAPSQNLLYADREGNIGYQLPGDIPLRGRGDGSAPMPGWDKRYDWTGMIDFDQLPYSYNPPSGYIVAANQTIIGPRYPHPLTAGQSFGWRSQQLVDRITAVDKINPATAETLFNDDTVRYAEDLLPTLLKAEITERWVAEGQQVLADWDGRATTDSAGAAFFYVLMQQVLQQTFDDQLPASLQPSSGDRWYAVLAQLIKEPDNAWWDDARTAEVETRDDIIVAAYGLARKEITVALSRDSSGWEWGKLHRTTLRHEAFGEVAVVDNLFNRGDEPVAGGPAVVNAMSFQDRDGFEVTNGPTLRMMINWAAVDESRWINQSGNSGHAYHRNYLDQYPLWVDGELLPFRFGRETVEAEATETLHLEPSR